MVCNWVYERMRLWTNLGLGQRNSKSEAQTGSSANFRLLRFLNGFPQYFFSGRHALFHERHASIS
jgi:hypothetical protein